MLETIAATCRTVACPARLTMLYHLCLEAELPATEIARRSGMLLSVASTHLTRLTTWGFVQRRRSAAWVQFAFAAPEQRRESFDPGPLVRRAMAEPDWAARGWPHGELLHVGEEAHGDIPQAVVRAFDIVYDAATAFGNVRRLQIVRLLSQAGATSIQAIRQTLSMSRSACSRHVDKLLRRGYVIGAGGRWGLAARSATPLHEAWLKLVLAALRT